MRTYLKNMVYLLEALGFDLFSKPERTAVSLPSDDGAGSEKVPDIRFYTTTLPRKTSERAVLLFSDGSYTLKAGSKINPKITTSLPANVKKLRDGLLASGDLITREDYLELVKDIAFSKPSPASALVKGRSSTGYRDWLRESDDMPLSGVFSPSSAEAGLVE